MRINDGYTQLVVENFFPDAIRITVTHTGDVHSGSLLVPSSSMAAVSYKVSRAVESCTPKKY